MMTQGLRLNTLNHEYFESWSPNMAYLLGFTCADGCVYGGTLSWELSRKFESDRLLLQRFSNELNSTYTIEEKDYSFRLRIHSVSLVRSIAKFGIIPNKTKILDFPNVPKYLLRHFIRGFLDGDGWISMRNKRKSNEINLGFVNGSKLFMEGLIMAIRSNVRVNGKNLRTINKVSKGGVKSVYYSLDFYSNDAYNLIRYLFDDLTDNDLFLFRKYQKQIQARELFEESKRRTNFGKKWVKIENYYDIDIQQILIKMFAQENILPKNIAFRLGVSVATIYRWLEKVNLRTPAQRGSIEWKERIFGRNYGQSSIT